MLLIAFYAGFSQRRPLNQCHMSVLCLTLNFCLCSDHDHSLPGIDDQVNRRKIKDIVNAISTGSNSAVWTEINNNFGSSEHT